MYKDEIIAEVWRNRDSYAQKHNFNLDAMVADLQRRERAHPERLVNRSGCRTRQMDTSSNRRNALV